MKFKFGLAVFANCREKYMYVVNSNLLRCLNSHRDVQQHKSTNIWYGFNNTISEIIVSLSLLSLPIFV